MAYKEMTLYVSPDTWILYGKVRWPYGKVQWLYGKVQSTKAKMTVPIALNMYRFVFIHAQRITTGYSKGKLGWKIMGTLVLGRYNGNWKNNEPAR
jgi:hypothetical protein